MKQWHTNNTGLVINKKDFWLLPDGIEELLPPQAAQLEGLCRSIIDLHQSWGYGIVSPPIMEYLDSLLVGASEDLVLQTFKLVDQISGKMMGLRADIATQVSRIDTHILNSDVPSRFCYAGTVLRTLPEAQGGSRAVLQIGAELYGYKGISGDAEVISLMLETLRLAGLKNIYIDIGNVGIYKALVGLSNLNTEQQDYLFKAIQKRSLTDLSEMLAAWGVRDQTVGQAFLCLIDLNGDRTILKQAIEQIGDVSNEVMMGIEKMDKLHDLLVPYAGGISIKYDLAELGGYRYHNGIIFNGYCIGSGESIAMGGRYDNITTPYGQARAATGFSADSHTLLSLGNYTIPVPEAIYAPYLKEDTDLIDKIRQLRSEGEVVICALPNQEGETKDMQCNRILKKQSGRWVIADC